MFVSRLDALGRTKNSTQCYLMTGHVRWNCREEHPLWGAQLRDRVWPYHFSAEDPPCRRGFRVSESVLIPGGMIRGDSTSVLVVVDKDTVKEPESSLELNPANNLSYKQMIFWGGTEPQAKQIERTRVLQKTPCLEKENTIQKTSLGSKLQNQGVLNPSIYNLHAPVFSSLLGLYHS